MGSQWWYQNWGLQGEDAREARGPCRAVCSPDITAVLGLSLGDKPSHKPFMTPAQELPWHPPSGHCGQVLAVKGVVASPGDQGTPAARGLQEHRPQCGHRHQHPGRGRGLPYSPEACVWLLLGWFLCPSLLLRGRCFTHGSMGCFSVHTAAPLGVLVCLWWGRGPHISSPEILSSVSPPASAVFKLMRSPTSRMKMHRKVNLDPTQLCQTGWNRDLSLTHDCKRVSVENFTRPK